MNVRKPFNFALILTLALPTLLCARTPTTQRARKTPPKTIPGAKTEIYKRVGNTELRAHIFEPETRTPTDKRPAIVFFFGGGWRNGSPTHFVPQARYLASRGMVAITVDYRVYTRQKATVMDCVCDAKSAIRWVRTNAKRLGIDPDRIAAGGGSAGGHLAATTGTIKEFDDPAENQAVSSRPNAMILFNPALDLTAEGLKKDGQRYAEIAKRMGAPAKDLSPTFHVTSETPPTIIFHGTRDTTVPYAQVEAFTKAMKKARNKCEAVGFENQGHGFFNFHKSRRRFFRDTMLQADRFLQSLGYIKGKPTIDEFLTQTGPSK